MNTNNVEALPLKSLDEWEEDLLRRYPDPETIATDKSTEENTAITIHRKGTP